MLDVGEMCNNEGDMLGDKCEMYIQCKLRVSKRRKFAAQAPSLMGCTVVNMSGCVRWVCQQMRCGTVSQP